MKLDEKLHSICAPIAGWILMICASVCQIKNTVIIFQTKTTSLGRLGEWALYALMFIAGFFLARQRD